MLRDLLTEHLSEVEAVVRLVFRYDNAPHFPGLVNFPHHKHLPDKVTDTLEPSILNAIEEARDVESSG